MPEWATQVQAAELLGVHRSLVPKMIARGDLTPRRRRRTLSRDEVLDLAQTRACAAEPRAAQRTRVPAAGRPPDNQHDWLPAAVAAVILGCTEIALYGRATRSSA
ncbi:hypothetical protein GCM10023339_40710 [Alloalcanivorax gelatiniphagus]